MHRAAADNATSGAGSPRPAHRGPYDTLYLSYLLNLNRPTAALTRVGQNAALARDPGNEGMEDVPRGFGAGCARTFPSTTPSPSSLRESALRHRRVTERGKPSPKRQNYALLLRDRALVSPHAASRTILAGSSVVEAQRVWAEAVEGGSGRAAGFPGKGKPRGRKVRRGGA